MITLEQAIDQATKFTEGETFHAGSEGWKAVMARLLEEVKRKNPPVDPAKGCWMDDGQDCSLPDTCVIDDGKPKDCVYARGLTTHSECKYWKNPACQIAEETNEVPFGNDNGGIVLPPLTAAILADMIDHQADELADLAKEIDIYGLKFEIDSFHCTEWSKRLVHLAKQLREDANK